jgi:hypothetical protein
MGDRNSIHSKAYFMVLKVRFELTMEKLRRRMKAVHWTNYATSAKILVGVDGNAPRALTSLPSGTVLQTAAVGNTHNRKTGADGQTRTDNDFRRRLTRTVQYHYATSAKN